MVNNKKKQTLCRARTRRARPITPRLKNEKSKPCADYGQRSALGCAFKNINKSRVEQEPCSAQDRSADTDIGNKTFNQLQSCMFERFSNDSMQGGCIVVTTSVIGETPDEQAIKACIECRSTEKIHLTAKIDLSDAILF